eukprot:scaffold32580_cov33-Phaeocystis_antarctica.AAC.1
MVRGLGLGLGLARLVSAWVAWHSSSEAQQVSVWLGRFSSSRDAPDAVVEHHQLARYQRRRRHVPG